MRKHFHFHARLDRPIFDPHRTELRREDYRPSEYKTPKIALKFELGEKSTIVHSTLSVNRNPDMPNVGGALILDGEELKLTGLRITENGVTRDMDRSEFTATDKNLIIKRPPAGPFQLHITNEVNPEANTELSGIYMAGPVLVSQNEAHGFRRITYSLDRPDNLAAYDVEMIADKARFPVLLSNGNGDHAKTTDLGDGRHSISWSDPWPKPSYLFCVVAGDLKILEDKFTTMSGKNVKLRIAVQPGYEDKIDWAMESVKRAMKWDEDKYGREYDLDVFHVVAVDKFNAGAMENKGLNVFNVSTLVGDPDSSTDSELIYIEEVVGHEYFHNYSGDRVTLRDWFELTVKESLTTMREFQFIEDMHSKGIKRIEDATSLKAGQFFEDAGPSSHPVRPDSVEAFENIYSATIYTKGAHVIRMLPTIMGWQTWRTAMDEYFSRFDGQAVTADDFLGVMKEISGRDLSQFEKWYSQSGTPEIGYSGDYDAKTKTYKLTLTQMTPPTADQALKDNLLIPVAVGLIGESGKDIPLTLAGEKTTGPTTRVLELTEARQTFTFTNVDGPVVPSVLRDFSAPVKVTTVPTDDELVFRMAHDSDPYNKYEATERMMVKTLKKLISDATLDLPLVLDPAFIAAYGNNLANALDGDKNFNALTLQLPLQNLVTQDIKPLDPDAVTDAFKFVRTTLAKTYEQEFRDLYAATVTPKGEKYDLSQEQVGRRDLHNLSLGFLGSLKTPEMAAKAYQQFTDATNMTERFTALSVLSRIPPSGAADTRQLALDAFYDKYKNNPNVLEKWLEVSAAVPDGDAFERVRKLMKHESFDETNPNLVHALIGGFIAGNQTVYHNKDGKGYEFLADTIIHMNGVNASTATGLARRFSQFYRYDDERQELMVKQMRRIMEAGDLDKSVKEVIGKALDAYEKKKAASNDNKADKKDTGPTLKAG